MTERLHCLAAIRSLSSAHVFTLRVALDPVLLLPCMFALMLLHADESRMRVQGCGVRLPTDRDPKSSKLFIRRVYRFTGIEIRGATLSTSAALIAAITDVMLFICHSQWIR